MGKDEKPSENGKKIKKKSRKSNKNRKSDPVVNDISSLLSSSLSFVSPNSSFNVENVNDKNQKRKSLNRNLSSSSLDNFVVRTSRKSEELKGSPQIKENYVSEDDFEEKTNAFQFMMSNRNKVIENTPAKESKLKENKENGFKIKVGKKRRNEELEYDLKTKRIKKVTSEEVICIIDDNEKLNDSIILRRSNRKRMVRKCYDFSEDDDTNHHVEEDEKNKKNGRKKPSKVAPIFLLSTPKPKIDPEVLEAKKKFLSSGIPEALKKVIEKEKTYELDFDVFPKISHVQQKSLYNNGIDFWNLPNVDIKFDLTTPVKIERLILSRGLFTNLDEKNIEINLTAPKKLSNFKEILQKIKEDNPNYPVFKSFRILNEKTKLFDKKKRKHENLNDEMWTEKYKPNSHEEILGNNKKVLILKKWLESWVEYVNDSDKNRNKIDDEFYTDSNSSNSMNIINAMIVTGPFGCGKTMTIYALCNELNINVIELNASSKRTGKLLQEIQEATQSHQVHKKELISSFLKSSNLISDKKKLCLILIEDLDITFDQDEGFLNALNQLLLTTKRPIVITTTDINANILQKFINQYPIVTFSGLSLNVLGVWLQIVCLFEGVVVDLDDLGKVLEFFNGDVRKTLIQMQFFIQSGGSLFKKLSNEYKSIKINGLNDEGDDENYLRSVASKSNNEKVFVHKDFIYNFLNRDCLIYDFNPDKIWWNLPIILDEKSDLKQCESFNEILSFIDVFNQKSAIQNYSYIKDHIVVNENLNYYKNDELIKDLSNTLLKDSISFYNDVGKFEFDKPNLSQKRWLKKHQDCGKTFSHFAPFTYHTDKRSFALDYYPNLRAISRSEKHRASVNVKRKKRFYNYFKSFDFTCTESTTETVCNIFSIEND